VKGSAGRISPKRICDDFHSALRYTQPNQKMKRTLLILLLFIGLTSVYANEWRPYVGVAGLVAFPVKITRNDPNLDWDPLYVCPGTQFDFGIRIHNHEFYLGYFVSNSADQKESNNSDFRTDNYTYISAYSSKTKSWHEKRYMFGYRLYPIHEQNHRFDLILGAALETQKADENVLVSKSLVKSTNYPNTLPVYENLSSDSYTDSKKGKMGAGIMVESGFSAEVYRGLQLVFLSQVHFYMHKIKQQQQSWTPEDDSKVITPSFVFQLRYTFGKNN
jgi:hypothetical protein